MVRTNPLGVARQYVEASREGQAWLRRYCEEHDVDHRAGHATTYATTRLGEPAGARRSSPPRARAGLP
ncbi:hypothetical protein G5V59_03520 [Nocardioides sp. W3-2-3]|uniref:hypothetical protein n=1 Tax=Nocardioides convexus TaxID=2712224 RepID=UPI0024182866|nr:hypothetical protein [Nocardioides convexus]NGZ99741.1 hypothetical protein [Nocardioides convexus]